MLGISVGLHVAHICLTVVMFCFLVRSVRRNRIEVESAKQLLELAKANNQVSLDTVDGLRQMMRGAKLDLKMAAAAAADKLLDTAAKTAAVKEDGTIHLPAGSEVVVRADKPE